jgi:hypothetical protein
MTALERRWTATLEELRAASTAREAELQELLATREDACEGQLAELRGELGAASEAAAAALARERADGEARVAELLVSQAALTASLAALAAENVALHAAAAEAARVAVEGVAAADARHAAAAADAAARHAEEAGALGRRLTRALAQNEVLRDELSAMASSVLMVLASPRQAPPDGGPVAGLALGGSRRGSPVRGAAGGNDDGTSSPPPPPPPPADLLALFDSSIAPAAPLSPAAAELARRALGITSRAYP